MASSAFQTTPANSGRGYVLLGDPEDYLAGQGAFRRANWFIGFLKHETVTPDIIFDEPMKRAMREVLLNLLALLQEASDELADAQNSEQNVVEQLSGARRAALGASEVRSKLEHVEQQFKIACERIQKLGDGYKAVLDNPIWVSSAYVPTIKSGVADTLLKYATEAADIESTE